MFLAWGLARPIARTIKQKFREFCLQVLPFDITNIGKAVVAKTFERH